ncbi:MAG: type VI secretion system baseplate subunit TssF [Deltaproteobacteria bacterium]|nr:type VI secretion system baseplate subunit TssF [Deltaproteobacteria bacterium]
MFNRYFQQELDNLKDLGAEFSKAHPALAPMLSGRSTDPDVDRLLEGTAFLTALLRQKLDDEFPEIIHELVQLIWPHYLRPLPSASIVAFTPKPILKQSLIIPKGVQLASTPIEETSCLFQTCYPVEVHPLRVLDASLVETSGQSPAIRLSMEFLGANLEDWRPTSLRFFLGGDYPTAADLYLILRRYVKSIHIQSEGSSNGVILTPEHLKPVGFSLMDGIIPYPANSFPGYRTIQEYFILPEKFLFLDLIGWEHWQERGSGNRFEVRFELNQIPMMIPRLKTNHFVLSATPVINVFPFDADPIRLDHRKTEYRVRPSSRKDTHYQIYSIEKVTGFIQGTAEERTYLPFEYFSPKPKADPVYHITIKHSPVRSGIDLYLSVAYPPESGLPASETLSIELLCTNGFLPQAIRAGDISLPTSSSPEQVTFKNLSPPSSHILPPVGTALLWRLISHLSLNYASLASTKNIQELLSLYLFQDPHKPEGFLANQKRIAGIQSIQSMGADRLVSGVMMRGREIQLEARHDHFASQGDLFLFGSVLDSFLGSYASMNTFTRFLLMEMLTGETYQWPAKIGDHPLI